MANFREELNREDVPEAVDRLLVGMKNEVADTKARISALEAEIRHTLLASQKASAEIETCLRREARANQIGDEETARVAREYHDKYVRQRDVHEGKARALREEKEFLEGEVDSMLDKVREAQVRRDSLAASVGRTGARDSIGSADDLFSELDRMAEKIGEEERRADAAADLDARLAELKNRVAEDG